MDNDQKVQLLEVIAVFCITGSIMDKPGRTWSKYSDYSRITTIGYKTEQINWISETLKVFCTATTEVVKNRNI